MLKEGDKVPDFSLQDAEGKVWKLSDFSGKKFVVYFYPKDNTPGCTVEACSFRDNYGEFLKRGVEVVGISPDSAVSHTKFKEKHGLPFLLLADPDKKTIQAFGAYGEKNMYGKKIMGVIRSTFIVDASGTIAKAFPKVTPIGHAAQILSAL